MSKIKSLALSGVFTLAAVLAVAMAAPSQAQVRGGPAAVSPARGVVVTTPTRAGVMAGRPTLARPAPIRPDDRDGGNLQARLRNACFNEPNPPVTICRRYFGQGGPGATRQE